VSPVPGGIPGLLCSWGITTRGFWPPVWWSLESEREKYDRQSQGTRSREGHWRGQAAIVNYRHVLSSERAPRINTSATDRDMNLVIGLTRVPDTKTDWPTDRRS
jgi:hypothetical protein